MPTSFYDVVVPTYLQALNNLSHILTTGETYTNSKSIPESEVLAWRMTDDMLPLTFQVQTVCNGIKNCLVRVAGIELPAVEDNEKTYAELHARIAATVKILEGVKREDFDGKEDSEVVLTVRGTENKFTGTTYVRQWAVPNLYFHITTLYLLFRTHGGEFAVNMFGKS